MRVAVIGTGFGERVVASVWRRLGCDVEVLSPRDQAGIERACASQVDLVSIHSPPFLHHDHVMLALQHGRNVLCDKPFGRNHREAIAMCERAAEAGVLHFLNFEFRCHPTRLKVKQLIDAGAIGALNHISWSFVGSGLRSQPFRWLFDKDKAGGWIGAYGSHAIDTMRWLFDSDVADCGGIMRTEITERKDSDSIRRSSTAEDAYSAWFVMENGGTISMDTAFATPVNLPHRIQLLGSEGAIEIVDDRRVVILRPGSSDEEYEFAPPAGDPHEPALVPWFTAIQEAVRTGRQLSPSFREGVAVAQTIENLRARMGHVSGAPK